MQGETKWAGTKYKQVFKYYQDEDGNKAIMPEAKTCKLMINYLYIQGCDETQKMLENFRTQIDPGIDRQYDAHNIRNNATSILAMGASNTTIKSPETNARQCTAYKQRNLVPMVIDEMNPIYTKGWDCDQGKSQQIRQNQKCTSCMRYYFEASDYMYTYILLYENCVENCGAGVKILWHKEACARWVSTIQTMVHLLYILHIHWYTYYTYKYYYYIYTLVHTTLVQILLLHIYSGAYYTGTNTTATVWNT